VLFRGGEEKKIRTKIIGEDLLEAVIGLPPNLFYGTGIPACIMVCRAKGAKPEERKGKVFFINADREYFAGRAQNYLRPEHVEKIVSAFDAFQDIPGYAAVVDKSAIEINEWNLNIRRYADNAPPPEPHDVRAHLAGGVPKQEVADKKPLFDAHGVSASVIFVERDRDYYDFDSGIAERGDIKNRIENDAGLKDKEDRMATVFNRWWDEYIAILQHLPQTANVMTARAQLLSAFREALTPCGLLDCFKVSGVFASWWSEVQYDLKSLVAQGFGGLIDGWIDTIEDTMEDRKENNFEPEEDPLVVRLVPEYLEELVKARQEINRLEQEKGAFEDQESGEDEEEGEEEDDERPNYAERLKGQLKELKNAIKEDKTKIKMLSGSQKIKGSIKYFEAAGADTATLRAQLSDLTAGIAPVEEEEIRQLEAQLAPYNEILEKLKNAKKEYRTLQQRFIGRLREARGKMTDAECTALVLDILKGKFAAHLESYIAAHRQEEVAAFENWWEKYSKPLKEIDTERRDKEQQLRDVMVELYNVK